MSQRLIAPTKRPVDQVVEYFLAARPSRSTLDLSQRPGSRSVSEAIVASKAWSFDGETRQSILHDAALKTARRVCSPDLPAVASWYAIFSLRVVAEVKVQLDRRGRIREVLTDEVPEPAAAEPENDEFAELVSERLPRAVATLNPVQRRVYDAYMAADLDGTRVARYLGEPLRPRHSEMQRQNYRRLRRRLEREGPL